MYTEAVALHEAKKRMYQMLSEMARRQQSGKGFHMIIDKTMLW